jgi:hypothetical protein
MGMNFNPDDFDDDTSGEKEGAELQHNDGSYKDAAGDSPLNQEIPPSFKSQPMYRDGISSTLTYLIMATKPGEESYNCVCQGNGKIKFYPNPQFFNITEEDLQQFGINTDTREEHHGYVRYLCGRQKAVQLLTMVANTRGTVAMTPNMALTAPRTGKSQTRRHNEGGSGAHGFPTPGGNGDPDDE